MSFGQQQKGDINSSYALEKQKLVPVRVGMLETWEKAVIFRWSGGLSVFLTLELVVAKPLVTCFSTRESYLIFSLSPLL